MIQNSNRGMNIFPENKKESLKKTPQKTPYRQLRCNSGKKYPYSRV
jgi:hypothetical protein